MTQALALGINRRTLYRLRDEGQIERVTRGVFRLSSLPPLSNPDLVTVVLRVPKAVVCLVSALAHHGVTSFIRPRLVSLGLSLNRTPVGIAGGGLVVSALLARVCGGSLLDDGALCSGGARVPRLVTGPRMVLSGCSWASETPPDAEKPVHTRERMVHGSRVGQRLGFFVGWGSPDETVVCDNISRKLRRMGSPIRNAAPHRESASRAGEQSRTLRSHWPNIDLRTWLRWCRPEHRCS